MPAQIGYTKGVPMGGDLAGAPAGKDPTFLGAALNLVLQEAGKELDVRPRIVVGHVIHLVEMGIELAQVVALLDLHLAQDVDEIRAAMARVIGDRDSRHDGPRRDPS